MEGLKREILIKFGVVYLCIFIAFFCVIGRVGYLWIVEGPFWKELADERYVQYRDVKAKRGNIYSIDNDNGELLLLATDIPQYDMYIDLGKNHDVNPKTKKRELMWVVNDELFKKELPTLCDSLSKLFSKTKNPKSKKEYMSMFKKARSKEQRYVLVQKNISLEELSRMKKFPIIAKEIYKKKRATGKFDFTNAVCVVERSIRLYPYGSMARRTIGIAVTEGGCDTCFNGIDGYFSKYLAGMHGKRMERRINPGQWVPVDESQQIKAVDGLDIICTIDMGLQELAENSLRKCLDSNMAESGCVILMEVKTGYIKAIANLSRSSKGYMEQSNIAVSDLLEPGSTFKIITAMAMLDKGVIKDTSIILPTFAKQFPGTTKPIKDVGEINHGSVTLARALEMSSNVAMSQMVYDNYISKGQKVQFQKDLKEYFPFERLSLDIDISEPKPYINEKALMNDDILRLGFGYVSVMSPLQLLTFYNGIANNGKMMKPLFVSEVRKDNKTVEVFKPIVLKEKMCTPRTLGMIQDILKRIVNNGTGRRLSGTAYGIAGKTGTAEIGYDNKAHILQHRASFVGYFPADKPMYSCIVVVSKPQKARTHGGDLAAPVFRDLSDRVVGTRVSYDLKKDTSAIKIPILRNGNYNSYKMFCNSIGINAPLNPIAQQVDPTKVPNVIGMSARDAVYALEKRGMKVTFSGVGKVVSQSIAPGSGFKKGNRISLVLSLSRTNEE